MSVLSRLVNILLTPIRAMMFLFSRLIPGLKKVTSISLPARLAVLSFLALLITGIAVLVHFRLMPDRYKDLPDWIGDWRLILVVVGCIVLVPVCIYYAMELLLKGEQSRYPDLDEAWKAGLQSLQDHGIDLSMTPLFLVVGAATQGFASRFHTAARLRATVDGVSAGARPFQWVADTDYIFLHIVDASCLSRLEKNRQSRQSPAAAGGQKNSPTYLQTIQGGAGGGPAVVPVPQYSTGTMAPGSAITPGQPPTPGGSQVMRTLVPGAADGSGNPPPARGEITQQELEWATDRLRYVCQLLRKNRYPVCPINGVVAALPFDSIEHSHDQAQLALHQDLNVIGEETRLRFPLTLLVTEIEDEAGFKEFMRRFSKEEIERGRIGSKYGNGDADVWTPTNEERTRHLARSACKNIEDNIRQFYGRDDALQRPGNGKLFDLLSKIRGAFARNIESLCRNGLAVPAAMVVGCYFVAIGNSPDRQGFLESVVREKVIGNRGKLAWDTRANRENQACLMLSNLFALVALLSGAGLVFMLVKDLFFPA